MAFTFGALALIISRGAWPKGSVVLGPDTMQVKHIPVGEEPGNLPLATITPPAASGQYALAPCVGEDNLSPLWCVSTTDDDRKANMVWQSVEVQHVTGSDFIGFCKPTPVRQPSGRVVKDTAMEMKVSIPVLVNSKTLKDGEELVYFKDKVEKTKRALKPISATSVCKPKKARTTA
jgi:hypothetical protein